VERQDLDHRIWALKKKTTLDVITILEVVGYSETRKVESVKDSKSDQLKYLALVDGTTESFIDVRNSRGQIYRIRVDGDTLTALCSRDWPGVDKPSV
jgi:hypothetical protein